MEQKLDLAVDGIITTSDKSEMDGKYLTFFTQEQLFGIPIADVVQIVGIQAITEIPEFPSYAKGVINLRGQIIPVLDVRLRFGKPEKEYDERTCIVVTDIRGTIVGLIVDQVDAVTLIDNQDISVPPVVATSNTESYLTGIAKSDDRVILLMDTQRFLSDDMVSTLATVSE